MVRLKRAPPKGQASSRRSVIVGVVASMILLGGGYIWATRSGTSPDDILPSASLADLPEPKAQAVKASSDSAWEQNEEEIPEAKIAFSPPFAPDVPVHEATEEEVEEEETPAKKLSTHIPKANAKRQTFKCACLEGFKGNPYSNGGDKCRDEKQLYLEELFGMNRCYGCRYESALYPTYESANISNVLDVGTGACGVVRSMQAHGLNAQGVEAVSFPLEDRCADLLEAGVVSKAPLDALPFPDDSVDLVTAFNVLEYIPREKLDAVISELWRVARLRIFISIQLPDFDLSDLGAGQYHPENFFPKTWWEERLEAHNMRVSEMRQAMYESVFEALAKKQQKGLGLQQTETVFTLTKQPKLGSASARATERSQCVGCSYMPLVYSIYAPLTGPDRTRFMMHNSLIVGPSACNLVRGMLASPPVDLRELKGLARNEYIVEMGCPDLQDEGMITYTNGVQPALPYETASFDLVMSMFDLEFLDPLELDAAIAEIARVTEKRAFVLINTCGNRMESPNCVAAQQKEIQILKSRKWWA
eukprot:gene6936-8274_t